MKICVPRTRKKTSLQAN